MPRMDYASVFYAGIILPTVVTVAIFITFLACWFKYNLKERLLGLANSTRDARNIDQNNLTKHVYSQEQASSDIFETASDSAIDVSLNDDAPKPGEGCSPTLPTLPINFAHGKDAVDLVTAACSRDETPSNNTHIRDKSQLCNSKSRALTFDSTDELVISPNSLIHHATQGSNASTVTIADVHVHVAPSRLRRGAYPSIDTLVEERSEASPNKLYERSDKMSEFLHAVRAHTVASASTRQFDEARWRGLALNKQQYAMLNHPEHRSAPQHLLPAAHFQHASAHNKLLPQNDCNHGDDRQHRHHSRGLSLKSDANVETERQYYSSSSAVTWTPNIRVSTSSNNDNYTAVSISRV